MVSVAVLGSLLGARGAPVASPASPGSRITQVYLPLLVVNWSLLFYVCRIGRRENALPALIGRRWTDSTRAMVDVGLAVCAWVAVEASAVAWAHSFGVGRNASIRAILPATGSEGMWWGLVSVSVGFCEEVVYRGYLQSQFRAFTGSAALAAVLQGVLFGVAHGQQGLSGALQSALFGVGFGALAHFRRSLIPGIVCHVGVDLASGLLALLEG